MARLKAVMPKESGAWLNALSVASLGTLLDDASFRISIGLRLSLHELLQYLEDNYEQETNVSNSATIYIQPPENTRAETDEDSDLSDQEKENDESMIPYYGKHHAKQYIKGKPIRFGYKNWALCSNTGYMVSFDIYTGKSTNEKQFGSEGDVISLVNSAGIPSNKGFKLYFDNYFTSITLLTHLAGNNICATGTIRANRMEGCPFPDKGFWNKSERGTYKFLSNGKLSLTQWKDNKVVTMATNFEDTSVTSAKRWCRETKSKKNISQPKVIHNYNQRMGGVDKMDGLVAAYRSRIRQRKCIGQFFNTC
nr:piggyBac transposable element-derived protein 3-like [Leptinotarsa decemlineata]